MDHFKAGTRATRNGPADYFTGAVLIEPIIDAPAPAALSALRVSFAPGARTNWHSHPLGQTLFVVSGAGLCQSRGQPVLRITAGDTVWIAPDEIHWHGAAPDTAMTHVAMQEARDGSTAVWLEPVADADYRAPD